MKWAKKLLLKWVADAQRDQFNEPHVVEETDMQLMSKRQVDDHEINMEKSVKFSVLPARGGCVLEIKSWDKKEREWDTVTHVIPEGADVAHAVGQLVSMEMLRR
jgi:hypothetical protein